MADLKGKVAVESKTPGGASCNGGVQMTPGRCPPQLGGTSLREPGLGAGAMASLELVCRVLSLRWVPVGGRTELKVAI